MPYLIYTTPDEAIIRNDQAGADKGLAYHQGNGFTRYVWGVETEDGNDPRAVLVINNNDHLLTDSERSQLVDTLPDDWQHPEDLNA
tara:strand:+ start:1705 stop:1962 length:258 start_codon:yes stop_codon:yes gene_type:complete